MHNKFYVYVLYRDIGKTVPFYIGKCHGDRKNDHERPRTLKMDVNRHKIAIIRQCIQTLGIVPKKIVVRDVSEAGAFYYEKMLIARFGRRDLGTGILSNMTDGGEGTAGCVYTPEQRAKSSAIRKGIKHGPHSAETIAKLSALHKGRPKSESHRLKLRTANLGKVQSPEARAKNSAANKGRIVSDSARQKLSLAFKGRTRSADHCRKISLSKKGKKQSAEIIARQAASRAKTMANRPGPNKGMKFSDDVKEKMRQSHLKRWREIKEAGIVNE